MAEEVEEIAERVDRLTEHEIAFRKRVRQQGGFEERDLSAAVALMCDLGGFQDFTMGEVAARIAQTLSAARMAWPEPQPITDAQKTGERFLVWCELLRQWRTGRYIKNDPRIVPGEDRSYWDVYSSRAPTETVTYYLALPPDVKP